MLRTRKGGVAPPSSNSGSSATTSSTKRRAKNSTTSMKHTIICCILTITFGYGIFTILCIIYKENNGGNSARLLGTTTDTNTIRNAVDVERSKQMIATIRQQYEERYGYVNATKVYDTDNMKENSIQRFGDIKYTAYRFLRTMASAHPEFVLSFGGYSVTVGRGNHLHQSYPKVLERILQPLLKETLRIQTTVRNAAIGGIPSFPYGYCFDHFLGADASVVSWDYSMNEYKNDDSVLEAYIRQIQSQLDHPMIIVLDTNRQRCNVLQKYSTMTAPNGTPLFGDALCVGMAKDAFRSKHEFSEIIALNEHDRPEGFQEWDAFGASGSCPGRGAWHPKRQEHSFIGWNIAMYFVDALEYAITLIEQQRSNEKDSNAAAVWKNTYGDISSDKNNHQLQLPSPISNRIAKNSDAVNNLLYGHNTSASSTDRIMKQVSCRTNFLPATDTTKVLTSIIVSGTVPTTTPDNIMEVRDDSIYNTGWVYDVSTVERETKVKVENCGGLGYIDMKIALYGISESGPLQLWLPSESTDTAKSSTVAKDYFDEIILCEANEKRKDAACKLDVDLEFVVGGVPVTDTSMISGAGEYLKRQTCLHVSVPDSAKITKLKDIVGMNHAMEQRLSLNGAYDSEHVGVLVDVQVSSKVNKITRKDGACCISHIVWEQH